MRSARLAHRLATSIARHQSRGLVDAAAGMTDVVIHGRVDLVAVADEMATAARAVGAVRRSWSSWFGHDVDDRRDVVGRVFAHAEIQAEEAPLVQVLATGQMPRP